MIYAGIGSRRTPPEILDLMTRIAEQMSLKGYTLRSGAAPGADSAFEAGHALGPGDMEIYLPWKGFNGNPSPLYTPHPAAFEMAASFHPAWKRCGLAARKFHARNCHQILGAALVKPVDLVICWTPSAMRTGGTGQALRIAEHHGIPIHDLARLQVREAYTAALEN